MNKAFTLVELIVVITILAILWTLGFVSFQWYSQDAKWSKVLSDIKSLSSVIEAKLTEWTNVHNFIGTPNTLNEVTNLKNGIGTFAGGVTSSGSTYNVWNINFITLQQDGTDFQNTTNGSIYKIWTLSSVVNRESYIMYQIVWVKNTADTWIAIVKGNYLHTWWDELGLISPLNLDTGIQDNTPLLISNL